MDILWRIVIKIRLDLHGLRRSELNMVGESGRRWASLSGAAGRHDVAGDSILFSGSSYCRRPNRLACLAWLREIPQGRVNSCKICRLIKQVIGHVLKPWKDNAEYPLPLFDLVALFASKESAWAVLAAQGGRVTAEGSLSDPYLAYPP